MKIETEEVVQRTSIWLTRWSLFVESLAQKKNDCTKVISFLRLSFLKLYTHTNIYMWKILWYGFETSICHPTRISCLIWSQLKKQIKERLSALPLPGWRAGHHLMKTKSDLFPFYWNMQLKITAIICFTYFSFRVMRIFISICFDWMRYSLKFIIFLPFTISILSAMSVLAISEAAHQFSQAVAMRVLTLVYGEHKNILFPMCTSHFPQLMNMKRCYYWE